MYHPETQLMSGHDEGRDPYQELSPFLVVVINIDADALQTLYRRMYGCVEDSDVVTQVAGKQRVCGNYICKWKLCGDIQPLYI